MIGQLKLFVVRGLLKSNEIEIRQFLMKKTNAGRILIKCTGLKQIP
jgi:hypothetical protein